MSDLAVVALARKRDELAGKIIARAAALDQLRANLAHLNAGPAGHADHCEPLHALILLSDFNCIEDFGALRFGKMPAKAL